MSTNRLEYGARRQLEQWLTKRVNGHGRSTEADRILAKEATKTLGYPVTHGNIFSMRHELKLPASRNYLKYKLPEDKLRELRERLANGERVTCVPTARGLTLYAAETYCKISNGMKARKTWLQRKVGRPTGALTVA